jgi:hypothetical protein
MSKISTTWLIIKFFKNIELNGSFPHFHRQIKLAPCGNVENYLPYILFHINARISTVFSTVVVENISSSYNT